MNCRHQLVRNPGSVVRQVNKVLGFGILGLDYSCILLKYLSKWNTLTAYIDKVIISNIFKDARAGRPCASVLPKFLFVQ